jgi:hypothetical protein
VPLYARAWVGCLARILSAGFHTMAMENLGDPGSWGIIPVLIRIAPGFMGYACGLSTVRL